MSVSVTVSIPHDVQLELRSGPRELAREVIQPGQAVRLLDGNEYIIPRVPAPLVGIPDELTARLWAWWLRWVGYSEDRWSLLDELELAAKLLTINYRIELSDVLRLVGTDEVDAIIRTAVEGDEALNWLNAFNAVPRKRFVSIERMRYELWIAGKLPTYQPGFAAMTWIFVEGIPAAATVDERNYR